ncbi:IclR family transcriptional regulator C-terminal domain-containing protein [Sphingobium sp. B2]|uniref:IclR family transcriptional regulator domain-containing protein n=1 Tax=Sphingobium sp. B2 TaxID=2583228 RepID=UPI0011A4D482|nr:IclR family transcriptional regulator C-terminal domain-containing protein [Sphingobium sp. B2]
MHEEVGAEWQGDPEFMMSLARGLAVLRCFAEQERPLTIGQASQMTGLSRAAVRRCLYTLVRLGYAAQEDLSYVLRPKILSLGYAYLSSSSLAARAQPILDHLRDELGESCSLGVLEEDEVYYVARAEAGRIMSIALRVGSRLPLYATSMGRVLLAAKAREEQEAYLDRTELAAFTPKTLCTKSALVERLGQVRDDGFAIVDQELELGLRSIAVPVIGKGGVVAALNMGTQAARISAADLRTRCLPALRRGAQRLGMIAMM